VGTSQLVDMSTFGRNILHCRYLAHCPVMRAPGDVRWNKEVVYNCTWSLLNAIDNHNTLTGNGVGSITKVLVTGFGTGTGRISPKRCAEQMILALKHFLARVNNRNKTTFHPNEISVEDHEIRATHRM
jgi:O-acetyl-ADP-ribose deacetylase (regulator of RNase III)